MPDVTNVNEKLGLGIAQRPQIENQYISIGYVIKASGYPLSLPKTLSAQSGGNCYLFRHIAAPKTVL